MHPAMTAESESHQPNEFGFAGEPAAPEPEPERKPAGEVDAERIAVPSDDLTGAISDGLDRATQGDDADR
jgi:hypothetical protein